MYVYLGLIHFRSGGGRMQEVHLVGLWQATSEGTQGHTSMFQQPHPVKLPCARRGRT